MASTNCIYRAVTLTAGEVFVLPPGAVIVSATNIGAVTSSCGDIPAAELKCYKIRWVLNIDPEGTRTVFSNLTFSPALITVPNINNAWEDDDDDSLPITIENLGGGNQAITAGSISIRDLSALEGVITNSPFSGMMSDRKYLTDHNIGSITFAEGANWAGAANFRSGYTWFELYFKTTEDLAKTIYIEIGGGNDNIASLVRIFPVEIDCEDYPTTSVVTSC